MIVFRPAPGQKWPLILILLTLTVLSACRKGIEEVQVTEAPGAPLESGAYNGPLPPDASARFGRGGLAALRISPDGRYLAAGGEIGLFLYDAHTLADVWQLASGSPIVSLAFSPDGRLLAAGASDGGLDLVDVSGGDIVEQLSSNVAVDNGVYALAWANRLAAEDDLLLAAGFNDGTVLLNLVREPEADVDGPTVEVLGLLERQSGGVTALAFNHNGNVLASGNRQGNIRLYDSETLTWFGLLEGHEKNHHLSNLAWSPDSSQLASTARDGRFIVWDVLTMRPLLTYSRDDVQPLDMRYPAGGEGPVSIWQDGALVSWDDQDLAQQPSVVEGDRSLVAGRLAPDGPGWLGLLPDGRLVESERGDAHLLLGHTAANKLATAGAWSPDGEWLAAASGEDVVLWDVARQRPEATLAGQSGRIIALAWSPDGQTLAAAGGDPGITLWDVAAARPRRQLIGHDNIVADLAWSPDGRFLASAGSLDKSAIIWDAASGELRQRLSAHTGIWSLAWSPDSRTLATGSALGEVLLWDVSQAEARQADIFRRHLDWISALAWSPDGRLLASVSGDNRLVLSDPASGQSKAYVGHQAPILDVAFSHDGSRLATAGRDEWVILWDADPDGPAAPLQLFEGHTGGVNAVAWSPDDRLLASMADDGTIILWDADARRGIASGRDRGAWVTGG